MGGDGGWIREKEFKVDEEVRAGEERHTKMGEQEINLLANYSCNDIHTVLHSTEILLLSTKTVFLEVT